MATHTFILERDGTDFAHWRGLARWLWAQQVPPEDVIWHTEDAQAQTPDLFAPPPRATQLAELPTAPERALTVPETLQRRQWPALSRGEEEKSWCCMRKSLAVLLAPAVRQERNPGPTSA